MLASRRSSAGLVGTWAYPQNIYMMVSHRAETRPSVYDLAVLDRVLPVRWRDRDHPPACFVSSGQAHVGSFSSRGVVNVHVLSRALVSLHTSRRAHLHCVRCMLRLIRRPCFPHIRAIVGGAPALQATRATVGGASDLCAGVPAQEGLSQSIRPLVARSDPIQGSPVAGSHLGIRPPSETVSDAVCSLGLVSSLS